MLYDNIYTNINNSTNNFNKDQKAEAIYNQIKNATFLNFNDIAIPNLHWNIKTYLLDMTKVEDKEKYEEIMNRAMNNNYDEDKGLVIFSEEGKFLETGNYIVFLKIGEWRYEKETVSKGNA